MVRTIILFFYWLFTVVVALNILSILFLVCVALCNGGISIGMPELLLLCSVIPSFLCWLLMLLLKKQLPHA